MAVILAAAGASLGAGSSPADGVARLARASNAFAFELYNEVRKGPGNRIVSPASLSTALTMAPRGVTFKADHPFLFFIHDTATGLILFMGRVTDPAAP